MTLLDTRQAWLAVNLPNLGILPVSTFDLKKSSPVPFWHLIRAPILLSILDARNCNIGHMIQSSEAHCRHQMNDYGKFCAAHEFESKSRWMAVLWSHQSDTWFTYQWPSCWPGVPNWWTQHPHQHCCGMQMEVTTTTQHSDSGCHIYGGLPTYTWSHHSLGSLVWMF